MGFFGNTDWNQQAAPQQKPSARVAGTAGLNTPYAPPPSGDPGVPAIPFTRPPNVVNYGVAPDPDPAHPNYELRPRNGGAGAPMGATPGRAGGSGAPSLNTPYDPSGQAGAMGFLPRGAPGYDLRPGQYGIDPNTAIIPRYGQWQGRLDQGAAVAAGRQDTSPFREGQLSLAQQLADQAAGRGPSLAQLQLQRATDQNLSQAMALGQSLRGPSAGGQLRAIEGRQAGIAGQAAQDSAALRLQEQMQARGMLGNVLNAGRSGDHNQQAMNDNLVKFYTDAGLSLDQAQMRARMDMQSMQSNASLGLSTLNSANDNRNIDRLLGLLSGTAQGFTTAASAPSSGGGGARGGGGSVNGMSVPTSMQPVDYDASGTPIYSYPEEWEMPDFSGGGGGQL